MRFFATAFVLLGSVYGVQAQETVPPVANDRATTVADATATSAPRTAYNYSANSGALLFPIAKTMNAPETTVTADSVLSSETADPAAPAPKPKFLYSQNDMVRWELGLGFNWIRFRSSVFNASAVGLKTALTYYTTEWFGIEGNVSTGFAPEIFDREHVKLLMYGAGPKIAWRQNNRWDPWMHAILGGAHEQPQTASGGKNSYAIQLGGGADYNFNARFSGRLEGNYIRTGFFSQSQNNFQLGAGLVVHF